MLGMTLDECRQRMSAREFKRWCRWLGREWNQPSRTDHYLMQIAMEIRLMRYQMASKTAKSVSFKDVLLSFGNQDSCKQETVAESKSRWLSFVGFKRVSNN